MKAKDAIYELNKYSDKYKAQVLQRFFKTGKGEYGEGDIFIGITVPITRSVAKKYIDISLIEVEKLLKSKIHEVRLMSLLILVEKFKKGDIKLKEEIYNFYLAHTKYINNWDLVDLSAREIVGEFLLLKENKIAILNKLAKSDSIWERRISIVSTFAFIYDKRSDISFKISKILIKDKHDLIQKAVGWVLREVGKRVSLTEEKKFLDENIKNMSRTSIRYSIERFEETERKKYLLM